MWVRKRIDIGWLDLCSGLSNSLLSCFFTDRILIGRLDVKHSVESEWSKELDSFVCLSVRTGFDLLLNHLQFPAASELLMSAITIQDMARIAEHHGLIPVPVDLDPLTMAPRVEYIERAITPNTRAIMIAHLFGGIIDLTPYAEVARKHGLMLIEDCAQAFDGNEYRGHPESDVVMFSFGPIKTATALGGAILTVRDRELLNAMREQHRRYPLQLKWKFLKRNCTYTVLKFIGGHFAFGRLVKICQLFGKDYESLLNGAVRNFPADKFFNSIRQQPTVTLCLLLKRRVKKFSTMRQDRRIEAGRLLTKLLNPHFRCPGTGLVRHTFWVFPVEVTNQKEMVLRLREAGFDAATASQLIAIQPHVSSSDLSPVQVSETLLRVIYLPFYPEMPDVELRRMAQVMVESAANSEN